MIQRYILLYLICIFNIKIEFSITSKESPTSSGWLNEVYISRMTNK